MKISKGALNRIERETGLNAFEKGSFKQIEKSSYLTTVLIWAMIYDKNDPMDVDDVADLIDPQDQGQLVDIRNAIHKIMDMSSPDK